MFSSFLFKNATVFTKKRKNQDIQISIDKLDITIISSQCVKTYFVQYIFIVHVPGCSYFLWETNFG